MAIITQSCTTLPTGSIDYAGLVITAGYSPNAPQNETCYRMFLLSYYICICVCVCAHLHSDLYNILGTNLVSCFRLINPRLIPEYEAAHQRAAPSGKVIFIFCSCDVSPFFCCPFCPLYAFYYSRYTRLPNTQRLMSSFL